MTPTADDLKVELLAHACKLPASGPPPRAGRPARAASAGAEQATAPILPQDDFYQDHGAAVAGSSRSAGASTQTTHQVHTSEDVHNTTENVSALPPTDDKHELQRRQLALSASGPPLSPNTHEEENTQSGPSAPLIIDDDLNEYVLGGDEVTGGASENLPQYHR